ncbi:hypothetical protein [Paenibacillus sp. LjRoot56]|uniref:hypothetical protein n=1 Tax=Paenibacillus sp. LjRoot56 TaxID=3342333 RepID=UPI003ECC2704
MEIESTEPIITDNQADSSNSNHFGRTLGEITIIFVPIFTFLSYLFTYNYQEGIYSYYSIPSMFIEINVTSILENIFAIGVISTVITFFAFLLLSIKRREFIRKAIFWANKLKFVLGIVLLWISMIFSFYFTDGEKEWNKFLVYCIGTASMTTILLLFRWIFREIDKGMEIAADHAKSNKPLLITVVLALLGVIITCLCFVFSYMGQTSAYRETIYLTSTIDSKKVVLINTYQDSYIFEEIEKLENGKYRLVHNIKIVKPNDKNQSVLSLQSEELGSLSR